VAAVDAPDDGFREQLEKRISTYRDQGARIRTRLTELNHDLLDVDRRLEAAEELYRREFGLQPPGSEAPRSGRRAAAGANGQQQSWREAIVAILSARQRPLHVKEIWQALVDAGFQTESRDPLRSIVAIAVRDPAIERTAPNTYGLRGVGDAPQMSLDGHSTVATEGGTE
jgi:hypothetical protein